MKNGNLHKAKDSKKDEFYTQLSDIERELGHYKEHFKGKVVFCNCDDPEESHFWNYFALNFEFLKLKKVIATHFGNGKPAYKLEIVRDINNDGKINKLDTIKTPLKQNGDFRSPECIEILKEADIVVTNPPFSLFREYVAQLIEYNKKFLIIGSLNAISYKEIFKLIKENKLWSGYGFNGGNAYFKTKYAKEFANGVYDKVTGLVKFRNIIWLTNLEIGKRHEELILYKTYKGNEKDYQKYDNYTAINVDKTKDIPVDYKVIMGVPITFINKYNPDQFEILGMASSAGYNKEVVGIPFKGEKDARPLINGKNTYARVFIKSKKV